MNLDLPGAATEFSRSAKRAIVEAGGVDLSRLAERNPAIRSTQAKDLLDMLGVTELDVRAGEEAAYAGVELCRLAGYFALPFPVAALLGRPPDGPWRFATLVDAVAGASRGAWADHGDLEGPWVAIGTDGSCFEARPVERRRNTALAPFVQFMELGPREGGVAGLDRCWLMNLTSWQLLGAAEAAHRLAVEHVTSRRQFGKALARFQGVQFHIADGEVAIRGLRLLAGFTLWRSLTRPEGAVTDALTLRSVALDVASTIMGTSQLLHGATGFCDEHDLTVVFRAIQAPLRIPTGLERTNELLTEAIDTFGFESLFSEDPGVEEDFRWEEGREIVTVDGRGGEAFAPPSRGG